MRTTRHLLDGKPIDPRNLFSPTWPSPKRWFVLGTSTEIWQGRVETVDGAPVQHWHTNEETRR